MCIGHADVYLGDGNYYRGGEVDPKQMVVTRDRRGRQRGGVGGKAMHVYHCVGTKCHENLKVAQCRIYQMILGVFVCFFAAAGILT